VPLAKLCFQSAKTMGEVTFRTNTRPQTFVFAVSRCVLRTSTKSKRSRIGDNETPGHQGIIGSGRFQIEPSTFDPAKIEPRILPLVVALNSSGLFETFSSCEGHFGRREHRDRQQAEIRMYALTGVAENVIEAFCHKVLLDFINSPTQWHSLLSIRKEYVALNEPPKPLTSYFVFEIKPFNARESPRKKREHVDTLLHEVTASVERHTRSRYSDRKREAIPPL